MLFTKHWVKIAVAAVALIIALSFVLATMASATPRTVAPEAVRISQSVPASRFSALLASLRTDNASHTGYLRKLFHHWIDADSDRCSTRAEVLIAESKVRTTQTITCKVLTGKWYSPYDNRTVTQATLVDIDHVVALAEAWRSGAYNWTYSRREQFANDLGYGPSLIAVTASSNNNKSDKDPAIWLPPTSYRCTYAASWVGIKWRWNLAVDSRERTALKNILSRCGAVSVALPRRA